MMRDRQAAIARGSFGELLGVALLLLKGYRIVARRYRSPVGEIDIIARRGGTLCFVEVKARDTSDVARSAITARQQERIIRASQAFVQGRPDLANQSIRFDAVLVIPGRWPIHIVDAWRPAD